MARICGKILVIHRQSHFSAECGNIMMASTVLIAVAVAEQMYER